MRVAQQNGAIKLPPKLTAEITRWFFFESPRYANRTFFLEKSDYPYPPKDIPFPVKVHVYKLPHDLKKSGYISFNYVLFSSIIRIYSVMPRDTEWDEATIKHELTHLMQYLLAESVHSQAGLLHSIFYPQYEQAPRPSMSTLNKYFKLEPREDVLHEVIEPNEYYPDLADDIHKLTQDSVYLLSSGEAKTITQALKLAFPNKPPKHYWVNETNKYKSDLYYQAYLNLKQLYPALKD
jgi:hypothetical protein